MKIFLAYAFRDEDKPLAAEVKELLRKRGMELVTGEDLGGEALTPEVQQRIDGCDGLIALLTRREALQNGGWTTHPWVVDELGYARARKLKAVAVVEEGVGTGGMYQPHEHIPLDRAQLDKALLRLGDALHQWNRRRPWPVARWALLLTAALLTAGVVYCGLAWRNGQEAVAASEALFQVGSYSEAIAQLQAACTPCAPAACFARDKAALGAMLESEGDAVEVERFSLDLRALQGRQPGNDPDLMLFDAALALHQRDPTGRQERILAAARALQQAAQLRPGGFPEALYRLADLNLRVGNSAEAERLLTQALGLAPNTPHYLSTRAQARLQQGDLAGAEADLRQSAEGADGLIVSRVDLAPLLWRQGRDAEAEAQLNTALASLKAPLRGRNRQPWSLVGQAGRPLNLTSAEDKTCYTRLAGQASQALQGRSTTPDRQNCGPHGVAIALALAASLEREAPGRGGAFVESLRAGRGR